jgi:hypothetical protein
LQRTGTLSGPILSREVDDLLKGLTVLTGVRTVALWNAATGPMGRLKAEQIEG